jgi:hypothetical protein
MTPAHVHQTLLTMLPVLCADFSLHPPPSLMPPKKYCDITGLEAPYRDPHTGLQYHSREVYEVLKTLVCPEYLPVALVGFGLTPACFSCSAARGRPAVPRDPRQGLDDQVRRSNTVLIASRYRSYRHASCYVALSASSPRLCTPATLARRVHRPLRTDVKAIARPRRVSPSGAGHPSESGHAPLLSDDSIRPTL